MYNLLKEEIAGFTLYNSVPTQIAMSSSGIAWPSDIGRHVKATDGTIGTDTLDVSSEHWLVWFRPAARSDFYKLNGVINQDLPKGTYTVKFLNRI